MEKIININFQGRVIPIEETAYNNLKQYIDGLRNHFANEESNDEIINDIENRIAELLSERLKHGANCIGISDLNQVIDSIGRIEDIEAAEGEENKEAKSSAEQPYGNPALKGRFYRNADDKVIAGVCSGIAARTGIDPVIVRILFVLLIGALFWIYILLWIIVPSQSIRSNVTRRLYRNPDDKVIAGVCGGLAAYFHVDTWIPRLIFVLPLLLGILSRGIHAFWWHWSWGWGPRVFAGSFGSTLFILYVILWIALPYASSATDKLEMRGEKIDINSIKSATQSKAAASPAYPRRNNGGLGRIIGILFKAFFLFIAGIIALSFFGVLIGLVSSSFITFPLMDFILDGWGQNFLVWTGIILFFGIPMLALITWIVRRLIGVRSHRHYLGYVFAGLWVIGLISILTLTGFFIRDFNSKSVVEEQVPIIQPSVHKLYINVNNENNGRMLLNNHHYHWFENWDDNDNVPFQLVNKDSLWLTTVKVNVTQSADSLYHLYETKISRGQTSEDAKMLASHISFNISQHDSIVTLPAGFTISSKDKFRNQQVMVVVEVPVGKEIQLSKDINDYNWFNIDLHKSRDYYYKRQWRHSYIMTPSGAEKQDEDDEDSDDEINKD